MSTLTRLSACMALILACCGSAAGAAPAWAGGVPRSVPRGVTVRITPSRVPLGQTFTVTLSGAQPGALYTFVAQPAYPVGGFGGGLMGEHRADPRGRVVFVYPAGVGAWEAGPWHVTAQVRGHPMVARATVTFVAPSARSGQGRPAAVQGQPAACSLTFPSSHNLRVIAVSSGVGRIETLAAGGYSFTLSRYLGFNADVRQATGLTPPPGDTVVPFEFAIPGGHSYLGLTNVVRQGSQERVCLRDGVAYHDLGNGSTADRVPPVTVRLVGTLGATQARVDLYIGAAHFFVYGRPRTQ